MKYIKVRGLKKRGKKNLIEIRIVLTHHNDNFSIYDPKIIENNCNGRAI